MQTTATKEERKQAKQVVTHIQQTLEKKRKGEKKGEQSKHNGTSKRGNRQTRPDPDNQLLVLLYRNYAWVVSKERRRVKGNGEKGK